MKKAAVFIDIHGMYLSSKMFSKNKVCYKSLMETIGKQYEVIEAKAYATHVSEEKNNAFYDALREAGIEVISKQIPVIHGKGNNNKIVPVNFEVQMTVDAMSIPEPVETVIFCTGNGNFEPLVKALKEDFGVSVEIWFFNGGTSERILRHSSKWVPITEDCLLGKKEKVKEIPKEA
jgi:uncharacterized LabA/DUF88 family protein